QLNISDRELVITNVLEGVSTRISRRMANLSVSVESVAADWVEVAVEQNSGSSQDIGSTAPDVPPSTAFSVSSVADGTSLVRVDGDAISLAPDSVIIRQVFKRSADPLADLNHNGLPFSIDARAGDEIEVFVSGGRIGPSLYTVRQLSTKTT